MAAALLAGCAPGQMTGAAAEAAAVGLASPQGAMLAYEHELTLHMDSEAIAARMRQVQDSCQQASFGDCAVLEVRQNGGDETGGRIRMRLAPAAVEPTIAQASAGSVVGARNTHAEDLAVQMADTQRSLDRLEHEHARLMEFQQRRDLAVADLLQLSSRLAEVETELGQLRQSKAQHQRRVDTQLLTLDFSGTTAGLGHGQIGQAVSDVGALLAGSVAFLIRAVAVLLPVGVAIGGLWLALRWWWRRRRR